jgi:glycosyltransferase involved in cell wall biosynthesis
MVPVRERFPSARLVLAANLAKEEDVESCEELCRGLGLDDCVDIRLGTPFSDIPDLLSTANVTVAPRPDCPGFPVKLLNYMAAGRAIVVPEGSAKGLEDGRTALVVRDHDWEAMGEAIARLLDDPELAAEIGGNALSWVQENFSWSSLSLRVEKLYSDVLGREVTSTSTSTSPSTSTSTSPSTSTSTSTQTTS